MALPHEPSAGSYEWHSQPSGLYNCVAWAIGETTSRYWPVEPERREEEGFEWPDGVIFGETVEAMEDLLRHHGFRGARDGSREIGIEKVALYTEPRPPHIVLLHGYERHGPEYDEPPFIPSHMAWQLEDGRWASKGGGGSQDVLHMTPEAIASIAFGEVHRFYARSRQRFGVPEDPYPDPSFRFGRPHSI